MIVSFRQTDEVPLSLLVDDDSSDWWGGAQRCFAVAVASTALAASLLTAGISRQVPVDEQAPTLSAPVTPVDEDYWTAPPPVQAVLWQKLPLGDPEEIPGNLSGQPDEDYWVNPTAPVPASVFQRLPYLMDGQDDPAGTLRGQPDEDCWLLGPPSSPASIYQRFPYLFDPEEIPAGSLFGQDDEDFWTNPVAPVTAFLYQRLPLGDPEELPAGNLSGQDDEDLWQNRVVPVPAVLYQRLPYLPDPEELNAGTLFGPVEDEDFWVSGVAPVQATLYQRLPYLPDTEETAGNLKGQPDEDYWTLGPVSVPASLYQRLPVLFDPEELNAGSLFGPVEDEDYWQNRVTPVQSIFYQPLPYLPDTNEASAGTLFGVPEIEQWLVLPIQPTVFVPKVFTDEDILPLIYVLDDDAGRIWVPCATAPQVQAFSVDDVISALSIDEDYWQRYPSNGQAFLIPAFGFSDEVKGFVLQPDEDFWILRTTSSGWHPFRHIAFAPDWDAIGGLFIPASGTIVKGSAVSKVTGRAIQIVRADPDQRIKGK